MLGHEVVRSFGVGAEVSARIYAALFRELKAPVPFAKRLETAFIDSHADIEEAVRQTMI